jgi:hypothetical protein
VVRPASHIALQHDPQTLCSIALRDTNQAYTRKQKVFTPHAHAKHVSAPGGEERLVRSVLGLDMITRWCRDKSSEHVSPWLIPGRYVSCNMRGVR